VEGHQLLICMESACLLATRPDQGRGRNSPPQVSCWITAKNLTTRAFKCFICLKSALDPVTITEIWNA
jgi:hypothetical protein